MKDPEWWEVQGEQWKFQPEGPRFQPGDKVVCVDDTLNRELTNARSWCDRRGSLPTDILAYPGLPKQERLYVIRAVCDDKVLLVGITAGRWRGYEVGFSASRFKLLAEYREECARRSKHGFWAKMEEMQAFENECDCYNRDGSLSARGKKKKQQE